MEVRNEINEKLVYSKLLLHNTDIITFKKNINKLQRQAQDLIIFSKDNPEELFKFWMII